MASAQDKEGVRDLASVLREILLALRQILAEDATESAQLRQIIAARDKEIEALKTRPSVHEDQRFR